MFQAETCFCGLPLERVCESSLRLCADLLLLRPRGFGQCRLGLCLPNLMLKL